MKRLLFLAFTFFQLSVVYGQKKDTTAVSPEKEEYKDPRPKRAAIMSAILPGLGQAYNHKYWKIPIIYAGAGTLVYFYTINRSGYKQFSEAYKLRLENDPKHPDQFIDDPRYYNADQLKLERDYYRRNRDLTIIIALVVYGLNIVDANIDAQLRGFKMSNDLSLKITPFYYSPNNTTFSGGLSFNFYFK